MRLQISDGHVFIDLSVAEARVFLDELVHVRGGARLPKIRQVCDALEVTLGLVAPRRTGTPELRIVGKAPPNLGVSQVGEPKNA